MPSRNVIRYDAPESYYHVYARGNSKQPIFLDEEDSQFFCALFARYLSILAQKSQFGEQYPHYRGRVQLLAYCLMGNHFHLLLYQADQKDISSFMQSLLTSYTRHFNNRHKRSGSLFESRYKASRIDSDGYLQHISRYIHLNPRYWQRYPLSSITAYLQPDTTPEWLQPQKITELFPGAGQYKAFVSDYEAHKEMLDELKYELADQ